jgi:uncharacterized repeat protein (TIGR01451 family)
VAPASIAKAFNPAAVLPNATTSLTFTLTNPAVNTVAETGVAFTDPLPAGLTVSDSSLSVCGGTLTTTHSTGLIVLSGARVEVNSQCQFSVTVTATTSGPLTNVTEPVSSDNGGTGNTATAVLNAGSASLTISLDDSHAYARYGQVLNYLLKISNTGATSASDIGISETFSPDIDAANVQWICIGGDTGASCTASGTGPLSDSNVVIPASRSLTWLISAPVFSDAPDASVDNTINVTSLADANAPYNVTDSDILVLFRDGFDDANVDGTGSSTQPVASGQVPTLSPLAHPLAVGQTLTLTIPGTPGREPVETLLRARAIDGSGFRIERLNLATAPYIRLVSIGLLGMEQPGNWVKSSLGGQVAIGLVDGHGTLAVLETAAGELTIDLSTQTQEVYQVEAADDSATIH